MERKRIGVNLTNETSIRLKRYVLEKCGSMRGLSDVVEIAVREYLSREEAQKDKNQ
jgi:metal-responsive CopG/Arc/MetJ family transcriptional regulator